MILNIILRAIVVQVSADAIAQKRAEIAAKMAAMTAKKPSTATVSAGPVLTAPPSSAAATTGTADDLARRVAEAKRRVSEAQSKIAIKDNPYMVCRNFDSKYTTRLTDTMFSPCRKRARRASLRNRHRRELGSRWRPIPFFWTRHLLYHSQRKTSTNLCSPSLPPLR